MSGPRAVLPVEGDLRKLLKPDAEHEDIPPPRLEPVQKPLAVAQGVTGPSPDTEIHATTSSGRASQRSA